MAMLVDRKDEMIVSKDRCAFAIAKVLMVAEADNLSSAWHFDEIFSFSSDFE